MTLDKNGELPVCMGMERSGSTLAWQMASRIFGSRLSKTHEYRQGTGPGLYTYRNPIEAFVSLVIRLDDVYPRSIAMSHAMESIYLQAGVYRNLVEDSKNGRNIVFLKYEDYYLHPGLLLSKISEDLDMKITERAFDKILYETSIDKNEKVSRGKNFGDIDTETQLHGNHIHPISRGRPGFFIESYSRIDDLIKDERIIELCSTFGYNLK